jgi:hypothetical protein
MTAHDKLTSLFNSTVEYFNRHQGEDNEVIVGGWYPIKTESSFFNVIKKGYKGIEPTEKSIEKAYCEYCKYLIAYDTYAFVSSAIPLFSQFSITRNIEDYLVEDFIMKKYGKIF